VGDVAVIQVGRNSFLIAAFACRGFEYFHLCISTGTRVPAGEGGNSSIHLNRTSWRTATWSFVPSLKSGSLSRAERRRAVFNLCEVWWWLE